MNIHESGENYLEVILILQQRQGSVRAIDIATEMGYSKPTISIAMRRLREDGYITTDEKNVISLTDSGREIAESMYERHLMLTKMLQDIGVEEDTAASEACKIEHDISAESFRCIKDFYENYGKNPAYRSILTRRSIKSYRPEQISDEELDAILEAGIYAPSASNLQSPIIVVTQKPEDVAAILALNQAVKSKYKGSFYGAPTVLNVFADKESANGIQDACLVMGNLMNAAHALGVGSCWISRAKEVFESEGGRELMEKWGIDKDRWTCVAHCVLGYPLEVPAPKPRREGRIIKIK